MQVVLGIGTNLGALLDNLREAVRLLSTNENLTLVEISSIYQSEALLPENAPENWDKPFLNLAVLCQTRTTPEEVLSQIKQIEQKMGRQITANERWAPRIIDIDILAWDNLILKQNNLEIPHPGLLARPFALLPLLDLLPNWQHPDSAVNVKSTVAAWSDNVFCQTRQIKQRIDTTSIVGILNVTPDSFFDGGQYDTVEKALAQAKKIFSEGAEIIDIGAESTRPGATLLDADDEWQRLFPVIEAIQQWWRGCSFRPKISIDTRHYQTAEKALALGVDWINDVSGFADPSMCAVVAASQSKCVVMHNLGVPACKAIALPTDQDVCEQVIRWAQRQLPRLVAAGIRQEQLIFDVGIGFGKTALQDFTLLQNIAEFKQLGVPLLVGHSRKYFFTAVGKQTAAERDIDTAIVTYHLAHQQVDYVRVHDVATNVQAIRIAKMLNKSVVPFSGERRD